jgi:Holliday junction DNA helicase RuvA
MKTRVAGILNRVLDDEIRLQVGPIEYQVLVPECVRRQLQTQIGQEIALHTTEYLEGNQMANRWVPRLIGFVVEAELEFFELLCTVEKVGVRKALKAMARPVKEIAEAIHRQDPKWLTTLPGVGAAIADQMVTSLKKKVVRFAMAPAVVAANGQPSAPIAGGEVWADAYLAMLSVGMPPLEARTRLDQVQATAPACTTVQEILNLAFKR